MHGDWQRPLLSIARISTYYSETRSSCFFTYVGLGETAMDEERDRKTYAIRKHKGFLFCLSSSISASISTFFFLVMVFVEYLQ